MPEKVIIYLFQPCMHQKCATQAIHVNESLSGSLLLQFIPTAIEKPGHWMKQQFHSRLTVRNFVIICLKVKKYQLSLTSFDLHIVFTSMYFREESSR